MQAINESREREYRVIFIPDSITKYAPVMREWSEEFWACAPGHRITSGASISAAYLFETVGDRMIFEDILRKREIPYSLRQAGDYWYLDL